MAEVLKGAPVAAALNEKMAADVLNGADIMTMPVSIVSDSEPVYSNANLAKFDMAVPADYAGARVVGE